MTTHLPDNSRAPQPGDILVFARPHRAFDYVIKIVTLSRYYHAALYAGDNQVIESRPNGVRENNLTGREGAYVVVPAPEDKGAAALAWAKTQIGAGYDRVDMLVMFLEHIFTHLHLNYKTPKGKYTCAEFVATAFDHAGVRLFPKQHLDDVEPKDFIRLFPKGKKPH